MTDMEKDDIEAAAERAFDAYRKHRIEQGDDLLPWEELDERLRNRFRAIARALLPVDPVRSIPLPEDREKDLAPEGSPRRAVALVLRLHADDGNGIARHLRELADGFAYPAFASPNAASVTDGPHLTAGYDSSYTLFVARRDITHEAWAVELKAWVERQKAPPAPVPEPPIPADTPEDAEIVRKARSAGFGGCVRCGHTWNNWSGHDTPYAPGRSMFPLCVECWGALTPAQRLPYYSKLIDQGQAWSPVPDTNLRAAVRDAVMRGL